MLRAYSTNITATANQPIAFNTDKLDTDASISHISSSTNILLNTAGYYNVDFNISATTPEAVSDPITIQLYANNVAIPDAVITQNITTGEYSNMTFNTLIKANVGIAGQNVTLTIVPSADLTIANTAIGINRVLGV